MLEFNSLTNCGFVIIFVFFWRMNKKNSILYCRQVIRMDENPQLIWNYGNCNMNFSDIYDNMQVLCNFCYNNRWNGADFCTPTEIPNTKRILDTPFWWRFTGILVVDFFFIYKIEFRPDHWNANETISWNDSSGVCQIKAHDFGRDSVFNVQHWICPKCFRNNGC